MQLPAIPRPVAAAEEIHQVDSPGRILKPPFDRRLLVPHRHRFEEHSAAVQGMEGIISLDHIGYKVGIGSRILPLQHFDRLPGREVNDSMDGEPVHELEREVIHLVRRPVGVDIHTD